MNGFATLDDVINCSGHCEGIDFLSIDTEVTELDVLRGINLDKHKPALILVEDKGVTLAKHRHLVQHGYKLVKRTQLNNWYVPRDTPCTMTGFWERLQLWRKVFGGYPFRIFRHWRRHRAIRVGSTRAHAV